MARRLSILIVEDEPLIALGLAFAVEDAGSVVIGPAATTIEALKLMAEATIDAAILDVNLADRDVTPVALALLALAVPLIFQTGSDLPAALTDAYSDLSVLRKPVAADHVMSRLLSQMPALH